MKKRAIVVTITNRKGGTAKTETARAITSGLLRKGIKALALDLEPQGNLTVAMGADASRSGCYELLNGANAADLIQHTPQGDIIAASSLLYTADKIIGTPDALRDILDDIHGYEYIIIDTAPSFNALTVAAMVAADGLLIPTQADLYSLSAMKELRDELDTLKAYNQGLKVLGVCITRYSNNRISRDMKASLETIAQFIGSKVYRTAVRECVAIKESGATGKSIFEYAPRSNGAADYADIVAELLEDTY
jgi:chromosome partitioning protein